MPNLDSYYEIGASHVFCQDYAIHGTVEANGDIYHYAIVSDGCSNSPNSDFGARLVSWFVPLAIKKSADVKGGILISKFEEALINEILNVKILAGAPAALDATMLVLIHDVKKDELTTYCRGDGKVVYNYRNPLNSEPSIYLTNITFQNNAPFYLSYVALGREEGYEKDFGKEYGSTIGHYITPTQVIPIESTWDWNVKRYINIIPNASRDLLFAAVMSDGVNTYQNKKNLDLTMAQHVLYNELINYKNFKGEFVKRRMMAFKRQCEKEGWVHQDDVSVSAINFT